MVTSGRIAGGVLAIIGAVLVIFAGVIIFEYLAIAGVGAIIWGLMGVIGGAFLLADNTVGGILALIGGINNILGIFIGAMISIPFGAGLVFVDPFFLLVGGIVGIAVGSEL